MAVLLGRTTAGSGTSDFFAAGATAIWGPFVASASGKLKYIYMITQQANATATAVDLGAYTDSAGEPGANPPIATGLADSLAAARGATIFRATMATPADIVSGSSYWLGVHASTENFDFKGDALANAYRESATAVDFPTWNPTTDLPGGTTVIIWGESEEAGGSSPANPLNPRMFMYQRPGTPFMSFLKIPYNSNLAAVTPVSIPLTLTLTPSVSRVVNRSVPVALTLNTSVSRVVNRTISTALTLATSVSRLIDRKLSTALTLATSVSRVVNRVISVPLALNTAIALARTLAIQISLALTLNTSVSRVINRNVSVPLTLATTLSRVVKRVVSVPLTLATTLSRVVNRTITVPLTLAASVSRVVQRKLATALNFTVSAVATFVSGGTITNINISVPLNLVVSMTIKPLGAAGTAIKKWFTSKPGWY